MANLIKDAITNGYALALGYVGTPTTQQWVNPGALVAAWRAGWSWAEALAAAAPTLNSTWRPIGDPLASLPTPLAGWDLFGPLDRLEAVDPLQPGLALREDELNASLDGALQPAEGHEAVYLIRRVDTLGRSEAGSQVVRIMNVQGEAVRPPMSPVWPGVEGWPVLIEDGEAQPIVCWERPLGEARVQEVQLRRRVNGQSEKVIQTVWPGHRQRCVQGRVPLTEQPAQFSWFLISSEGASAQTGWSKVVQAAVDSGVVLQSV